MLRIFLFLCETIFPAFFVSTNSIHSFSPFLASPKTIKCFSFVRRSPIFLIELSVRFVVIGVWSLALHLQKHSRCLHVGNLDPQLTEEDVRREFSAYGDVKGVRIVTQGGRRTGTGDVMQIAITASCILTRSIRPRKCARSCWRNRSGRGILLLQGRKSQVDRMPSADRRTDAYVRWSNELWVLVQEVSAVNSSVDVTFDVVMFDVRCLFVYTKFRECRKSCTYLRFDDYSLHFTSCKKEWQKFCCFRFHTLYHNIGFIRMKM